MSFVHLHVHSEYSLLDGFSNIKKLVARAKAMGMPAIALTDHGTMFGIIDFYNAAKAAEIKPIIGVESYMAARGMHDKDAQFDKRSSHVLLLAENQVGYQNLLKIASAAQLEGYYYYPRIDHDFLAAHAEGVICTSGCMSAEVPRMILQGKLDAACKRLDWYYDVFGKDRFFFELQSHNLKELDEINKRLLQLGERYDARFIATNDVHYIEQEDSRLQDILLAIQTGKLLSDPDRMRMTDPSYYLRSPEEMSRLFAEVPEAISNTLLIAERCEVDLGFKGYRLPEFSVPEGHTAQTYLRQLCEEGLRWRYGEAASQSVYQERLNYELGIIHTMGFDAYFLIVWDLCQYAKKEGIWYNARGSAAGSIVAYSLGITMVDPIEHQLIFERFLNPGRVSMPDIDLDFRDDRRPEMMEYTARKYGDDKVAQIITFGTMKARAAIRDVGRVKDIPINEVDRVAKLVPNIPGKPVTIGEALETVPEFKQAYDAEEFIKDLIDTAKGMEGVVRNAGTHAAGVVVTDKPIVEYLPLHRPTSGSQDSPVKTVTQFEMSIIDNQGLLKVDFLGLATLTVMARACDLICQRHRVELTLDNIPLDDPETFELLGRGETAGVFQVEGSGMRRNLVAMKPRTLDHVIAMVALFRPGPMDFIPSYIARMHGEEEIEYLHPQLEPILKETYGITVYQEQIMYTAMNLAGYTASEADFLRKAVAKKKADVLLKQRDRFVSGAMENGIPDKVANEIFDNWEAFARYGFPKGHAADYGVIAVQTAYLKTHYPVEYMTALLAVEQNNTDKVALYVADCRRMGIDVLPPDVNSSGWDFTIEDCSDEDNGGSRSVIRFGLGAIKNVGQGPVETIVVARKDGGPFIDLNDFARRVDLRSVGKRAMESMIKVGALERFGSRPQLLAGMDQIISVSSSHFKAANSGQMSLFGAHTGVVDEIHLPPVLQEISRREILNWERELIGLYVSDHPLSPVMDRLSQSVSHFSGQLNDAAHGENVRVAGMVVRIRNHQTKSGKQMAFATLEDIQGPIELVIFPRTWSRLQSLIQFDQIIVVEGKVDNPDGSEPKILVDHATTELKYVTPLQETIRQRPLEKADPRSVSFNNSQADELSGQQQNKKSPKENNVSANGGAIKPALSPPPQQIGEPESTYDDGCPPPPDNFPEAWNVGELVPDGFVLEGERSTSVPTVLPAATQLQPLDSIDEPDGDDEMAWVELPSPVDSLTSVVEEVMAAAPAVDEQTTVEVTISQEDAHSSQPVVQSSTPNLVPYIVTPHSSSSEGIHMLTITMRTCGDQVRDNLRLRQAFGVLFSYPGKDRFAFHVFERGRGYRIEFPNFTTGLCPELLNLLQRLVDDENIRIEPLVFQ